ncbi:MAG: CgeB family protein [Planctomycetota bacterium]|jgi:hypothetical protein
MTIDCLFVGVLKDYGRPDLELSHEYFNLWTGLHEHPRLSARGFFPDQEAMRYGADGMRQRFADAVRASPLQLIVHQPFTAELDIDLDVIGDLTREGVATVEFDADSSWRFEDWIRPRLGRYALYVTTHEASVEKYRAAGAEVHLSQWAVSSWYRGYDPARARETPASFVGRAHGTRRGTVAALRRAGLRVDTWGPGWGARRGFLRALLGRGVNHGYVTFSQLRDAIGSSVVSLNLANASVDRGGTQIKGRHFEIPALGACQLTTPSEKIEQYFEPGAEIVVAEEGQPLSDALRELLRDAPRARRIAEAGWRRTWAEHTWKHRIDGMLAALGL